MDIYDRSRYNTNEMVPLVAKVATKFTKVFVIFDYSLYMKGNF